MGGRQEASYSIDGLAKVVSPVFFSGTYMQSHPYLDGAGVLSPLFGVKGTLSIEGGLESLWRGGEGSAKGITHRLEDVATVGFYGGAQEGVMAGEGGAHSLGLALPTLGW